MKLTLLSVVGTLLPLVTATPVLKVDIQIGDDALVSSSRDIPQHLQQTFGSELAHGPKTMTQRIPGWVFIEEGYFRARTHGSAVWIVKGKLDAEFPFDDFLFDPLLLELNSPEDFKGTFNGTIAKGGISLKWEKSGATIVGRSPVGDFKISGETDVVYT